MTTAIIIPAFNEERSISETVKAALRYGTVIVADDRSTDQTAALAKKAGATVITALKNGGYDQALNLGFAEALRLGFSHAITFDADGQHPADQIPVFQSLLNEGAALVIGQRPSTQRWAETVFAFYTKIRFGVNDPLCGMKGYDLRHWPEGLPFDSCTSTGTEMMIRYLNAKSPYKQILIYINGRADLPRFGRLWNANKRILKSLYAVIKLEKNLS